jgi:UDP-glucose:(heptosyl)LPS alpha-1,3-glucosyltransferase
MKIALTHLRHASVGGTERFLNQISSELANRGHDVTIICRTHESTHHPDINFISLRGIALGRGHRLWRFAKAVEKYLEENHYDLVFGLGRTWTQDVVRVGGGLYRDQISKGRGKRRYWPRDLIAEAIERKTFAEGNYRMVIANSHLTENSLIKEYNIPDKQITTIHNAVDINRFNDHLRQTSGKDLRSQCGFTDDHKVYLFLGSGFKRKGLDRLLDAFPHTLRQEPQSRLIIVGHDSAQESYIKRARKLGIYNKVQFLGKRNDAEACYNAADIYVMPTRFDAFGFSALEALACGLPVIITDTAGAAEVMTKDVGVVISSTEKDFTNKLAQAMSSLVTDARDSRVRKKSMELASDYAEKIIMDKNISVLESTLSALP